MGFQRVDNPLVRSRAESPCRVWDSVPQEPQGALQERAFPYSIIPYNKMSNVMYLNIKRGSLHL